jgi:hypothetical protein
MLPTLTVRDGPHLTLCVELSDTLLTGGGFRQWHEAPVVHLLLQNSCPFLCSMQLCCQVDRLGFKQLTLLL